MVKERYVVRAKKMTEIAMDVLEDMSYDGFSEKDMLNKMVAYIYQMQYDLRIALEEEE